MADTVATPPSPLTTLSEEETLFRDAVREFAETDVRPGGSDHSSMHRKSFSGLTDLT